MKHEGSLSGIVITATRRHVQVYRDDGTTVEARLLGKNKDTCIGDRVYLGSAKGDFFVEKTTPRENTLKRSYFNKTKILASNLDSIYIVAARTPVINTVFVDRVQVVAHTEDIPVTLVVNKIDLEEARSDEILARYQNIGFDVVKTSVTTGEGMAIFAERFEGKKDLYRTCFTGMSGVGKSSLLQYLLPHEDIRTADVSRKTGQGKQTTTQSFGYLYPNSDKPQALIIDLPGVQNFGVSHLQASDIASCFPEFLEARLDCEYTDCMHTAEPRCGIKQAVDDGRIAEFRYHSYLQILAEIDAARPY